MRETMREGEGGRDTCQVLFPTAAIPIQQQRRHHVWMQRVIYPPVLSVCASTDALRMIDASASASVKLDALHTCTPTETVKSQVCTLPTCAHPPLFSYP